MADRTTADIAIGGPISESLVPGLITSSGPKVSPSPLTRKRTL